MNMASMYRARLTMTHSGFRLQAKGSRFVIRLRKIGLLCLALTFFSLADEGHHHEDKQQFGTVHFPTSCDPKVQKTFERGVALLHSFAFETAEATFRQVAADDPRCAIAHWGIARTFSRWDTPTPNQLKQGWQEIEIAKSLHPKTERERDYISATFSFYHHPDKKVDRQQKYLKGMEKVYRRYPDDYEAAAFYAFALMELDREDDPTHAQRKAAAPFLKSCLCSSRIIPESRII